MTYYIYTIYFLAFKNVFCEKYPNVSFHAVHFESLKILVFCYHFQKPHSEYLWDYPKNGRVNCRTQIDMRASTFFNNILFIFQTKFTLSTNTNIVFTYIHCMLIPLSVFTNFILLYKASVTNV